MGLYSYGPLEGAVTDCPTRLVVLNPGSFDDEICIELNKVCLTSPSSPPLFYEAISYVWGSLADPVVIKVEPGGESISVTRNLADAFRYLRHETIPRILWADAVCINQNDPAERRTQIAEMANIYRLATRVVVWLGLEADNSARGMDLIRQLGADDKTVDWSTVNPTHEEADGLFDIYHRQWFERLWIRQEVRLACSVIVLCGRKYVPWTSFRNTTDILSRPTSLIEAKTRMGVRYEQLITRMDLIKDISQEVKYSLKDLRNLRGMNCTDPRDRIFGMLALLDQPSKALGIIPDYEKPAGTIYQDIARKCYEEQSFSLLDACEFQDTPLASSMPSWVPDWSTVTLAWKATPSPVNASSDISLFKNIAFPSDSVMRVYGMVVGRVQSRIQIPASWVTGPERRSTGETVRELWRFIMEEQSHICANDDGTLCPTIDQLCELLCCGIFEQSSPFDKLAPDWDIAIKSLTQLLDMSKDDDEAEDDPSFEDNSMWEKWNAFEDMMEVICGNRALFITEKGEMGMGPFYLEAGDDVCVLIGSESTYMFRSEQENYRVIGWSYLPSVNSGQAILGPLPDNLRLVKAYDEKGGLRVFLKNDLTGELLKEDPRFKTLGIDEADLEVYQLECRDGDGWILEYTVEELRQIGIDVQAFDLV